MDVLTCDAHIDGGGWDLFTITQYRYGQTIYAANGELTVNKWVSTLINNMTNNQHKNINAS